MDTIHVRPVPGSSRPGAEEPEPDVSVESGGRCWALVVETMPQCGGSLLKGKTNLPFLITWAHEQTGVSRESRVCDQWKQLTVFL